MARQEIQIIGPGGGTMTVDRLTVHFPEGTFREPTEVVCTILDETPNGPSYLTFGYAFEIEAKPMSPPAYRRSRQPNSRPAEVTAPLSKPVVVAVDYRGLFPLGSDLSLVSLVALDQRSGRWQYPSSQQDSVVQVASLQILQGGRFGVALNTALRRPEAVSGVIGPGGGSLQYAGRVTVEFMPGTVDEDVRVEIGESGPSPTWRGGFPFMFSLSATRVSNSQLVRRFKLPVKVWFVYEAAELGVGAPARIRFKHLDERRKRWVPITTKVNPATRETLARVDRPMSLAVTTSSSNEVAQEVLPTLRFASSDLFTGSSSISYPIELPPGTAGLTPQLFLTYNGQASYASQRANHISETWFADHGFQSASPVGQGFELDCGSISFHKGAQEQDDLHYLSLSGQTHELVLGTDGKWHTTVETYLRIERDVPMPDGRTAAWRVINKDGTQYLFGCDAVQRDRRIFVDMSDWDNPTPRVNKWMLGQVRNTHGNTIEYRYERLSRHVWRSGGSGCSGDENIHVYTPAVFLERVEYAGGMIQVRFNRSNRNQYHPDASNYVLWKVNDEWRDYGVDRMDVDVERWVKEPCHQHFFDVKVLEGIDVSVDSGATWAPKYRFTYKNDPGGNGKIGTADQPLRLHSIRVWGKDASGQNQAFPTTTVFYDEQRTDEIRDTSGTVNQGSPGGYAYWVLQRVENGLGGEVLFDHEFLWPPNNVDAWGPNGQWFQARIARVWKKTVKTAVGPDMGTRYEYEGPVGNGNPSKPEFRGHRTVKAHRLMDPGAVAFQTPLNSSTSYVYEEHQFCQGLGATCQFNDPSRSFTDAEQLRGREFLVKAKTPAGTIFAASYREWQTKLATGGTYFPCLKTAWEYTYGEGETNENSSTKVERRVGYADDAVPPNLLYDDYGNVLQVRYYGSTQDGNDDYTLERQYVHTDLANDPGNPGKNVYIVDRVKVERNYQGIGTTGAILSEIGFYYDDRATFGAIPTKGELVRADREYNYVNGVWVNHAVTDYWYDTYGNRVKEQSPIGVALKEAGGDPNQYLTQYLDGPSGQLGYDATYHAYPYYVRNALNHDTVTEYDARWGKQKKLTDPNLLVVETSFDAFGRETTVMRASEDYQTTEYYEWPSGPRFEVRVKRWVDAVDKLETRYLYDGAGRLVQRQTASVLVAGQLKDIVVDYTYDQYGRKASESVPYATTTYGGSGNPYKTPDTSVRKTTWAYDALDRVTQVTSPEDVAAPDRNYVETYHGVESYNSVIREFRRVTDQRRHRKEYFTDAFGRLLVVKEYSGEAEPYTLDAETRYDYDRLGNLTQVTDNEQNVTKIRYDERGLKTKLHDPDMCGSVTDENNATYWWSYSYDVAGNLNSQTDPMGRTLTFSYDMLNRVLRKTVPKTYSYPLSDPLPPGAVRGISASDLHQLRAAIDVDVDALGSPPIIWTDAELLPGSTRLRAAHFNEIFSAIGQLWQQAGLTWPPAESAGRWPLQAGMTSRVRDTLDLRSWLATYEQSGSGTDQWVTYRYDGGTSDGRKGRRTAMTSPSGSSVYQYDRQGRVITEQRTLFGATGATRYTYDRQDRVKTMTFPDGEVLTYTYDPYRLKEISTVKGSQSFSYVQDVLYNAHGRPMRAKVVRNNSLRMTYNWGYYGLGDPINDKNDVGGKSYGRLWRQWSEMIPEPPNPPTPVVIHDLKYEYDAAGNVTRYMQPSYNDDITYTYDHLDRMVTEQPSGAAAETFQYNTIGNLTARGGTSYRYPGIPPDPAGPHPHAMLGGAGQWSLQYDANGNGTVYTAGATIYRANYDAENHLVSYTQGPNGETLLGVFYYDGDGKRTRQVVNYRGGGKVTVTYYGPHGQREHFLQDTTRYNDTKYIWADLGFGPRLLALSRSGNLNPGVYWYTEYWLHLDHLGSVVKMTDLSGSEQSLTRYKAYGEWRQAQAIEPPPDLQFTGQYHDQATGLYWYGSRYYNPGFGRFLQPDTVVPDPANPQQLNRYSYALNNPLRYADPTGHAAEDLQHFAPGWFDQAWQVAFEKNHGRKPGTAVDYVQRFITMARAHGWAGKDIMQPVTIAIGAGLSPSGPGLWSQSVDQTGVEEERAAWRQAKAAGGSFLSGTNPEVQDQLQFGANYTEYRWGQIRIIMGASGKTGDFVWQLGGQQHNAVTFSANLIVFTAPLDLDNPMRQWWLLHELRHVMQARGSGATYLPGYIVQLRPWQSHDDHPMESDANSFATAAMGW